jgi:hypothetical protein
MKSFWLFEAACCAEAPCGTLLSGFGSLLPLLPSVPLPCCERPCEMTSEASPAGHQTRPSKRGMRTLSGVGRQLLTEPVRKVLLVVGGFTMVSRSSRRETAAYLAGCGSDQLGPCSRLSPRDSRHAMDSLGSWGVVLGCHSEDLC